MLKRTIRTIVKDQEILTAPVKTSASDAARLMKQRRVGAILVVDNHIVALHPKINAVLICTESIQFLTVSIELCIILTIEIF